MDRSGNDPGLQVDVSRYVSPLTRKNRVARLLWSVVAALLFRPSPRPCFAWRRSLLRLFGARVGREVKIYPTTRVWAPWNLRLDEFCAVSDHVDCYSVAPIHVGAHATVSQYSFLCTATHDVDDPRMKLATAPIAIGDQAWICADVFVSPGVTVGQGGVAGARAVVTRDVAPWTIVAGNPARPIRERKIRAAAE